MTLRIPTPPEPREPLVIRASAASRDESGTVTALVAYSADQPRVESGPGGGQWTSTGDSGGTNAPEVDAATKLAFQQMLSMSPAQRAAFLASMSPDQLKKMGALMAMDKSAKGDIAQIRNAVGDTLKAKGIDPASVGLGPKGSGKKKGAKGKSGGKGEGGGSKGGGGKSGGGKKSSGGGKSSGGSSKGSSGSSSKSSGSKSSSSKSSGSSKTKTTTTTTAKTKAKPKPAPPVVVLKPSPGGSDRLPKGPGGDGKYRPIRASGTPRVTLTAAARPQHISLTSREETKS